MTEQNIFSLVTESTAMLAAPILAPNMVITVEPGMCVSPTLDEDSTDIRTAILIATPLKKFGFKTNVSQSILTKICLKNTTLLAEYELKTIFWLLRMDMRTSQEIFPRATKR